MSNMKDVTFIFPVYNLNTTDRVNRLSEAYKSLGKGAKAVFVGKKEDLDLVTFKGAVKIENDDTSYPAQVMKAVNLVETKFFSVIEQDDYVDERWYNMLDEYIKQDNDEMFAYLPLTELVDFTNEGVIGYANEAFWAASFSEQIGYLDIHALELYLAFNVHGGVFKTDEFKALGGLKTSMKLSFWYEFLFRALYKQKKIFVIPRIGYYHRVNVPESLTEQYTKTMSEKEADWWIELAKKEYFFPQDRKKTYEEE